MLGTARNPPVRPNPSQGASRRRHPTVATHAKDELGSLDSNQDCTAPKAGVLPLDHSPEQPRPKRWSTCSFGRRDLSQSGTGSLPTGEIRRLRQSSRLMPAPVRADQPVGWSGRSLELANGEA